MMMNQIAFRCSWSALLVGLSASLSVAGQTAEVHSFNAPDGETYYAVSLSGETLLRPAAAQVDHVILFDTSASQVGEHRQHALAVVDGFLKALPAGDRVSLFAVDVEAVPMTDGSVAPAAALSKGMPVLRSRFPAGSTNIVAALNAALERLSAGTSESILYIGDGMSTAHLVQTTEMQELLGRLQTRRIPVHTIAVGPNTDKQMLGILSRHTGGRAMSDDGSDAASQARTMAAAMRLPVFYPHRIQFSAPVDGMLAEQPMPMRADQETIYLGRGQFPQSAMITLAGTLAGRPVSQAWTLSGAAAQTGNTFLYGFYRQSVRDGGLNPLAGMEMFRTAQQAFEDEIARLEAVGEQAIAAGDLEQAEQTGLAIKRVDPQNVRAEALLGAASELKVSRVSQKAQVSRQLPDSRVLAFQKDLTPREGEPQQGLIDDAEFRRTLLGEKLAADINQLVEASRRRVADDPAGVQLDLESALSAVKSATEIDPDLQAQLLRRVTDALLATAASREVLEARQIQAQRTLAEAEAQRSLRAAEIQKELRLAQLVDRIRALVYEGWQGNPDAFEEGEAVARRVFSEEPEAAVGTQTILWTEAAGQIDKQLRLRTIRADKFLAVLHQVELSHVPFPDEPPVNYPEPAVWRRLTERRAKWRSVDLHQESPNEERIYNELDINTQLEFVDTPLS
ncbi:MAG: hypothetical protein AB7I48_03910, partial [Planctomycetaceae bacterium]